MARCVPSAERMSVEEGNTAEAAAGAREGAVEVAGVDPAPSQPCDKQITSALTAGLQSGAVQKPFKVRP